MGRNPPIPISAVRHASPESAVITWDRRLTAAVLDVANWYVRYGNANRLIVSAMTLNKNVTLQLNAGIADPGPDVVSYSPPPFDVTSSYEIPAAAFADFPLA